MNREIRLQLFEKELRRLLQSNVEHDFVIFCDVQDPDHYVQYMRHDDSIYAEVGSLTWAGGDREMRRQAETALGCLGFAGTGPKRNYSRDRLPFDARRLACLAELLFGAAYGQTEDLTVLVMTRASREVERAVQMELDA